MTSTTSPVSARPHVPRASSVAELKDVTRIYMMGETEVRALDGISHAFCEGEYWSIMGSSGSGKSTLLNILGCIDRPTGGDYVVRGRGVRDLDDDDLSELRGSELGFVFQSPSLDGRLTARENLNLSGRLRGLGGGPGSRQR